MSFLADQLLRHRSAPAPSGFLCAPPSRRFVDDPQQTLERRLLAAQDLVRPGFMTLRPVRIGERIVDFVWVFASAVAGRMLGHNTADPSRHVGAATRDNAGCNGCAGASLPLGL